MTTTGDQSSPLSVSPSSSTFFVDNSNWAVVVATAGLTMVLATLLQLAIRKRRGDQNGKPSSSSSSSTQQQQSSMIDPKLYPNGTIHVYYASQTGTAEAFGRDLEREGKQYGFFVRLVDLEDVKSLDQLTSTLTSTSTSNSNWNGGGPSSSCQCHIFLCSVYGEGEPPDNAVTFTELLKRKSGLHNVLQPATPSATPPRQRKQPPPLSFDYLVFGLGNKQYDHYNAIGKYFDAALSHIGGNRVMPLGLGDDDADLEADFETWKEQMWSILTQRYGVLAAKEDGEDGEDDDHGMIDVDDDTTSSVLPECPIRVLVHDASPSPDYNVSVDQIHASSRSFFTASTCTVETIRELQSANSDRRTLHIELSNDGPVYETADNLAVLPQNDPMIVERLLHRLGYDGDTVISIAPSVDHNSSEDENKKWHGAILFPQPDTLRNILTKYYDLSAAPRRSDLALYSRYCCTGTTGGDKKNKKKKVDAPSTTATIQLDRAFLRRIASKDGRAEYKDKIINEYRNIVTLLEQVPSLHLPLSHFLHHVPLLQPRYFTIASSCKLHENIHLTVAVTRHVRMSSSTLSQQQQQQRPEQPLAKKKNGGKDNNGNNKDNKDNKDGSNNDDDPFFRGLCSNYLAGCGGPAAKNQQQHKPVVRVFVRPSSFRLPTDPTVPIILIGPGTGIAPMRAFLQERSLQPPQRRGPTVLYFGCRSHHVDFLYQDELVEYQTMGVLDDLRTAFSREGGAKVYVQHLLQYHCEETVQWIIHRRAHVYVCGAVQMGHDVNATLQRILAGHVPAATKSAKDYLDQMSAEGRYVQELWA